MAWASCPDAHARSEAAWQLGKVVLGERLDGSPLHAEAKTTVTSRPPSGWSGACVRQASKLRSRWGSEWPECHR
eukprot:8500522-Pyramimonas_sp.AAC.1